MPINLTTESLKEAEFRGPVRFYDGAGGMARQDFECVEEPRFGYSWERKDRSDRGRQYYTVDGSEVAALDEACRLLALPADPDSPGERMRREIDEFHASPSLAGQATRALSEARCNADGGPYGMIRAWLRRADNAWHQGINAWAESRRKAGMEFEAYRWLYDVKSAAHETYRAMYLFAAASKRDTGLMCAMGVLCNGCPILKQIEQSMIAARSHEVFPFPQNIEDHDIDAAKVWTCIGHILTSGHQATDGALFTTAEDRKRGDAW